LGAIDRTARTVERNPPTAAANPSTADKAPVYAETVDTVDDADKIEPFIEGWATVTDEELPSEFLKPTPPPAPQQEQLKI
jgi:hypothetical protein